LKVHHSYWKSYKLASHQKKEKAFSG